MDFREEYKKSAEVMTPSSEAMERMMKSILEQVKAPAKKAIPLKKISYIGGAVAACAVIAVGAVTVLPMIGGSNLETAANDTASSAYMYQEEAAAADEAENSVFMPTDGAEAAYDEALGGADMEYVKENTDSVSDYAADSSVNAAPSTTQTQTADKSFADLDGTDSDIMEEAVAEDESFTMECAAPEEPVENSTAAPSEDTSEAHAREVFLSEEDMPFEISDDTWTIYVDGIQFDYIDDGSGNTFTDGIRTKHLTAPDGTEYQLDFYHDEYLVLIKGGEILGGYARIM